MGGEKISAMAEGTALTRRLGRELDEGLGSGARGDGLAKPDDRRDVYGQHLGPPPEVRVPAAPLRKNPLIRKRLAPAVNAAEHDCYGLQQQLACLHALSHQRCSCTAGAYACVP